MAIKNKNSQINIQDRLQTAAAQVGLVLMAGAATLMTLESLQVHDGNNHHHKAATHSHPVTARGSLHRVGKKTGIDHGRSEETGPHFITYGAAQRTAARAGRA